LKATYLSFAVALRIVDALTSRSLVANHFSFLFPIFYCFKHILS
jgi:hypothetical protein